MTRDALLSRNNVRIVGDGRETIIFAHGFSAGQTAWEHQLAWLQGRFRCVLLDHVGSGSTNPAAYDSRRYSTLYSYVSDLLEIGAAPNLRQARVVAHSVSGMVAMLASLLDPTLFSRAAIIGASRRYLNDNPSGYTGDFDPEDLRALFQAMDANYHLWASDFAPLVMGNPERPRLAGYYADALVRIRPDISQAVLRAIFHSDHRAELPRIRIPVCILQSRDDIAVPDAVADYRHSRLPNSTLVHLRAFGHLPHVSAPHVVNAALTDWLDA